MSQAEANFPAKVRQRISGRAAGAARSKIIEWVLIAVVVLYAAGLLVAPLMAIVWGAFAEGVGEFMRQITSIDALSSLKLTLLMAVGATVINTVFGVSIAWVLVRDNFWGKRILNGLVDMPFAVSPIIAGFMFILLFGLNGWFTPLIDALGMKGGICAAWNFARDDLHLFAVRDTRSHARVEPDESRSRERRLHDGREPLADLLACDAACDSMGIVLWRVAHIRAGRGRNRRSAGRKRRRKRAYGNFNPLHLPVA